MGAGWERVASMHVLEVGGWECVPRTFALENLMRGRSARSSENAAHRSPQSARTCMPPSVFASRTCVTDTVHQISSAPTLHPLECWKVHGVGVHHVWPPVEDVVHVAIVGLVATVVGQSERVDQPADVVGAEAP